MVAKTHVHNDYVSTRGRPLAAGHWATHVLPAEAGYPFEHHPVDGGVPDWVAKGVPIGELSPGPGGQQVVRCYADTAALS